MSVRLAIGARGDLAGIVRVRACYTRDVLCLYLFWKGFAPASSCFALNDLKIPPLDSEE